MQNTTLQQNKKRSNKNSEQMKQIEKIEQLQQKDKSSLPPLGNIGQSAAKEKKKMNNFIYASKEFDQIQDDPLQLGSEPFQKRNKNDKIIEVSSFEDLNSNECQEDLNFQDDERFKEDKFVASTVQANSKKQQKFEDTVPSSNHLTRVLSDIEMEDSKGITNTFQGQQMIVRHPPNTKKRQIKKHFNDQTGLHQQDAQSNNTKTSNNQQIHHNNKRPLLVSPKQLGIQEVTKNQKNQYAPIAVQSFDESIENFQENDFSKGAKPASKFSFLDSKIQIKNQQVIDIAHPINTRTDTNQGNCESPNISTKGAINASPIPISGYDLQNENMHEDKISTIKRQDKKHKQMLQSGIITKQDQQIMNKQSLKVAFKKQVGNDLKQFNEAIDQSKPSQVRIVISEAKIKIEDHFKCYAVDPFVELNYQDDIFKTYVAKVGALNPRFNCFKNYDITDYETFIELNLYMGSISQQVPIGKRIIPITDLYSKDGNPINKWFNVFKPPGTEEVKEMYTGKVRLKITSINKSSMDNSYDRIQKDDFLHQKLSMKKSMLLKIDQQGHLDPNYKHKMNDSFRTDSVNSAIKSEPMSLHSSHGDDNNEMENHDLVVLGIVKPKQKLDRKCLIMYPSDSFAFVWEIIISVVLLVSCFTTPISLAFPDIETNQPNYGMFTVVLDCIFLFEIFINFRYAFEDDYFKIQDNSRTIAKRYLTGWFLIDVIAIFPIDIIMKHALTSNDHDSPDRSSKANSFVRMSRIGKLYKLVRITRLLRLVKVIKGKGKFLQKIGKVVNVGEGMERCMFSFIIFIMFSHFSACFWIFTAEVSEEGEHGSSEKSQDNWIHSGDYQKLTNSQLYITSFYFTITTMTTVGYGDISGTNTIERITCCILMIMGVLFFTYTSGTITNIITNEEEINKKFQEKKLHLTKLYKKHGKQMRSDLYLELLRSIQFESTNDSQEFNEFIETLPTKLKNECILLIHQNTYKQINFLNFKPQNFIAWICPRLKPFLVLQDQYVCNEKDSIDGIYFMTKGAAGFVLKEQRCNIVYLELNEGDDFGQVDIMSCVIDNNQSLINILSQQELMIRQYTIQALSGVEIMMVDLETMQKLIIEFFEGFQALFADGEQRLRRVLKQKLRAIKLISKGHIENDHELQFRKRFKKSRTNRDNKNEDEDSNQIKKQLQDENQHTHHHDDSKQCNIQFFTQSIPMSRLMERSLSQTLQTPNYSEEESEHSDEQQDNSFGNTAKAKSLMQGFGKALLFLKQDKEKVIEDTENQKVNIKNKIMSYMNKNQSTGKKDQIDNQDQDNQQNESSKKDKKQSSGKNRRKSIIPISWIKLKDQAEIQKSLQQKLDDLDKKTKTGQFDMLAMQKQKTNPLFGKLKQKMQNQFDLKDVENGSQSLSKRQPDKNLIENLQNQKEIKNSEQQQKENTFKQDQQNIDKSQKQEQQQSLQNVKQNQEISAEDIKENTKSLMNGLILSRDSPQQKQELNHTKINSPQEIEGNFTSFRQSNSDLQKNQQDIGLGLVSNNYSPQNLANLNRNSNTSVQGASGGQSLDFLVSQDQSMSLKMPNNTEGMNKFQNQQKPYQIHGFQGMGHNQSSLGISQHSGTNNNDIQAQIQQQQVLQQNQMMSNMQTMFGVTINMIEERHTAQMNQLKSQIGELRNQKDMREFLSFQMQREKQQKSQPQEIIKPKGQINVSALQANRSKNNNQNQKTKHEMGVGDDMLFDASYIDGPDSNNYTDLELPDIDKSQVNKPYAWNELSSSGLNNLSQDLSHQNELSKQDFKFQKVKSNPLENISKQSVDIKQVEMQNNVKRKTSTIDTKDNQIEESNIQEEQKQIVQQEDILKEDFNEQNDKLSSPLERKSSSSSQIMIQQQRSQSINSENSINH